MALLIKNIKTLFGTHSENSVLRGNHLKVLPQINNAFIYVENGSIVSFGNMEDLPNNLQTTSSQVDASSQYVLPSWVDSHTHVVFAASRENEFIDKINGSTYAEIAANGGGILNSAKRLHDISEDELFRLAWNRLTELSKLGTGAIEIKSGYGLSVESELKMLRVIKRLKQESPLIIKATFLGAHAFPEAFKNNHQGYIDTIINDMLPIIANEKLADYIDVFCEAGFFSPEEMEQICNAGKTYGLIPKLHVNQLSSMGGLQKALALEALTVDHLETMTHDDISDLGKSNTIGTLLPTAAYFLRMPFQPARQLIDAYCAIALASDFNPGSSPSGNMNVVVSMACIALRMLPEEAINAATINAAFAMGIQHQAGSIAEGKKANFIFTKPLPSLAYMPYAFGSNCIDKVMINGEFI